MRVLFRVLKSFAADERGATALEYGLICSLIFLVIVAGVQAVADGTIAMYDLISGTVSSSN